MGNGPYDDAFSRAFTGGKSEAEVERDFRAFWTRVFQRIARLPWIPIGGAIAGLYLAWRLLVFLMLPAWWLLAALAALYLGWRLRSWGPIAWLTARALSLFKRRPQMVGERTFAGDYSVMPSIAWGRPAQDDDHAYARAEVSRLTTMIPGLPRAADGDGAHEARKVFLYKAELEHGLHVRGDVVPVRTITDQPRIGMVSTLLRGVAGNWMLYGLGVTIAFGAFQFVRAEHNDNRADRAESNFKAAQFNLDQAELEVVSLKTDLAQAQQSHSADLARFTATEEQRSRTIATITRRNAALAQREIDRALETATRDPSAGADWSASLQRLEALSGDAEGDHSGAGAAPDSDL